MATIRKGDLVQVISGPTQERGGDRGKQGRVIGVQSGSDRVIVEGVKFVTKHTRVGQTQRGTKTGGIETMESPIHVSNIALVDPATKLPARVGFRVETDDRGKATRVRFFKPSRRVEGKKAAKAAGKTPVTKSSTTKAPVDEAATTAPAAVAPKTPPVKPAKAATAKAAAAKAATAKPATAATAKPVTVKAATAKPATARAATAKPATAKAAIAKTATATPKATTKGAAKASGKDAE